MKTIYRTRIVSARDLIHEVIEAQLLLDEGVVQMAFLHGQEAHAEEWLRRQVCAQEGRLQPEDMQPASEAQVLPAAA